MLVINHDNLRFFIDCNEKLDAVLERYPKTRLDLPEDEVLRLLRRGLLSRAQMLNSWVRLTPQRVEQMDIQTFARNELHAVANNPKINKLIFYHDVFKDNFPPQYFREAYDHITLDEAERFNVRLEHVLTNLTVSVEVKRALINKAFLEGDLPADSIERLKIYREADITPEVNRQLEQINHPRMLVDPGMLTMASFRQWNDLTSRLLLELMGTYSEDLTQQILTTDFTTHTANEFYAGLKGPATVTQTTRLMETFPSNRRAIQFLAAKGMFDNSTIQQMIDMIEQYGDTADMVALYENERVTQSMRELIYPHVSVYIAMGSFRRRLFDRLIVNASDTLLQEFCLTHRTDPAMFILLQTPRAFKRSALYCIEHIDPDAIPIDDVLIKCVDETFTDREQDMLESSILAQPSDVSVTRFLLTSGISLEYKQKLVQQLNRRGTT